MRGEPTGIVKRIIDLMIAHPEGLASGEIREKLNIPPSEQTHLDRRRRDVRKFYEVHTKNLNGVPKYFLGAKRDRPLGADAVSGSLRAQVLHSARGRCQMCGKSIEHDHVKLQVDHRVPQDWGGTNDPDNLQALCTQCNREKKNHFASLDDKVKEVFTYKSVHMHIGELLKAYLGQEVSSDLIDLVAGQDDWPKRTRDLRYLGWKIDVARKKLPSGRTKSFYTLREYTEWPEDPSQWIRTFEKERGLKNRAGGDEID